MQTESADNREENRPFAKSDENMSRIAPKPIIARVLKTWRVLPGMTFALVEDMEQSVWVVESCPAGTQFWTVEQAANLPQGRHTGHPLKAAVALGKTHEKSLAERKAAFFAAKSRVQPEPTRRRTVPTQQQPASQRSRRTGNSVLTNTGKALVAV